MFRFFTCYLLFCFFSPAFASAQCFTSGVTPVGRVFDTSGDYQLDRAIVGEVEMLKNVFGVSPRIFTLDDTKAANAFAMCNENMIALGLRLMREELWNTDPSGLSVAGILAHEFAHMYQCKRSDAPSSTKKRELQADFLAGWYMQNKAALGNDISSFARSVFSKGDYNFTSSSHHGTPDERLAAMRAGFASSATTVNVAFRESLIHLELASVTQETKPQPQYCDVQVPCQHVGKCQHVYNQAVQRACVHTIPCGHTYMTPYGPRVMHPYDTAHPYDVMHHPVAQHPHGDLLHNYDVERRVCR